MKTHMLGAWAGKSVETLCRIRYVKIGDNVAGSVSDTTCEDCLREYEATEFTSADHKAALAQGWLLGEDTIERDDDNKRFVDDNTAAAYVVGRAEAGCRLAQKALRYYGKGRRHRINGTLIGAALRTRLEAS